MEVLNKFPSGICEAFMAPSSVSSETSFALRSTAVASMVDGLGFDFPLGKEGELQQNTLV